MKRKKIIVLTSILTFSLNVFAPTIFAEGIITDSNIINSENSTNSNEIENKNNQETVENKESETEIKDDNNLNNIEKEDDNASKETTAKVDDTIESNNSDMKKEEITENDKLSINPNVENSSNETNKDVANENFSNTSKSEYAYIPDENLKEDLNQELGKGYGVTTDITISELQSLRGVVELCNKEIRDLTGIEHCTNIYALRAPHLRLTNIEPLGKLTQIKQIDISMNEISDLSPLRTLTNLQSLRINRNHISDLSPLAGLTKLNNLQANDQTISADQVTSVGSKATVTNIVKGIDGSFVEISSGSNYTYDSQNHQVIFNNISQTGEQSYSFSQKTNTQSFTGTVTQNIVYNNELAYIPDNNLKAGLNSAIASQTSTSRTDTQDITISELKSLKGHLEIDNRGIANLKGLEYCTNISRLVLNGNKITDISPIQNLTNLTYLSLLKNDISDISKLKALKNLTLLNVGINKISDISALEGMTKLTYLNIGTNNISDISVLKNLSLLETLFIDTNRINDISSIKNLESLTILSAHSQKVIAPKVNSVGTKAIVNNVVKDLNGNFVTIKDGNGYTYDSSLHNVIFSGISQTEDKSYSFTTDISIGGASATFSGTVTQNIVRSELADVPDNNLKTALNQIIASQTNTTRQDSQDISIADLQNLRNELNLNGKSISNLKGLEHCTNINTLRLMENDITDLEPLRNLTNLGNLELGQNNITNLEPLSGLHLWSLYLSYNQVSDLGAISNMNTLTSLYLSHNPISNIKPLENLNALKVLISNNTEISDIQPLKGLAQLNQVDLTRQNVRNREVQSVGPNAVVDNIVKELDGSFVNIESGDGYTYDSRTHKVIFTGITQDGEKSYPFTTNVQLGQVSTTFSGNVTQNIIYNELVEIPDTNLKAALNQAIARQTTTVREDRQDILVAELRDLKGTLDFRSRNISNITGLEYCTGIQELKLENNNISDVEPLRNLKNLVKLTLGDDINIFKGNNISNIEPLSGLVNLTELKLSCNEISNINALRNLTKLTYLELSKNKITDISVLQHLSDLTVLYLNNNNISDIKALSNLSNLTNLNLNKNNITDLFQLDNFRISNLELSMTNQSVILGRTTVDDGSVEIPNPVTFPRFYDGTPNISISPNGSIEYVKEGNKLNLSSLSDSTREFTINESATINTTNINGDYSVNIILPVEHVSTIKVDLPTSMTFNVVTNTVDSEPVFATADYTISNRGKKPVSIISSYTVTNPGGIDLVESISKEDIAKNNDVKVSVKLKNLSTNKEIMSVVNRATGTPFSVEADSNIQLRLEPGVNGMADAKKEQLSDTKTTSGKMTFTISN